MPMLGHIDMLAFGAPKYLFKCDDCAMIIALDLEKEEDIKLLNDDKLKYLCNCGGHVLPLRD
jgi:hypothetical protein